MNVTSPYWSNPEFTQTSYGKPLTGHLGFLTRLPWPEPVTVGAIYSGDGAVTGRREQNSMPFGEYFAISNKIPSAGGVPLINVHEPRYRFSRDRYTYQM
jgi:hypothetical protein